MTRAPSPFDNPAMARIYGSVDASGREGLTAHVAVVDAFDAGSILGIGCGTGALPVPAPALLDVSRRKPSSERVGWIHGSASDLWPLT